MKTKLTLILAATICRSLLAGDAPNPSQAGALPSKESAPAPACCPVEKSSCCAAEKPQSKDSCCAAPLAAAPVSARSLYQLDATWTNDAGRATTLAVLSGRPVVLAMMFTNCEYACPVLVRDMQRLRDLLPAETQARTQFVLVSFDTARDTPVALKTYRERMALDGSWTLLHGETGAVQELAMLLGMKFKQDARGQFAHSNLITILNPAGEIVHQHAGLQGDVSEAARAVVASLK